MNRSHRSDARRTRLVLAVGLLLSLVLTGCVKQRFLIVNQNEVAKVNTQEADTTAAPEAKKIFRNRAKVGFAPPEFCKSVKAGGSSSKAQDRLITAKCDVLMSDLQREALRAGYRVTRWKLLQGEKRPIFYAKKYKLDALIAVSDLGPNISEGGQQRTRQLQFSQAGIKKTQLGTEPVKKKKLSLFPRAVQRCSQMYGQSNSKPSKQMRVILNATVYSVKDGSLLMEFRKERGLNQNAVISNKMYFKAHGTSHIGAKVLTGVGGALLGMGAVLAGASAAFEDEPETSELVVIAGGASAALGGAMLIGGLIWMPFVNYPDPNNVICKKEYATPNPYIQASSAPQAVDKVVDSSKAQARLARSGVVRGLMKQLLKDLFVTLKR